MPAVADQRGPWDAAADELRLFVARGDRAAAIDFLRSLTGGGLEESAHAVAIFAQGGISLESLVPPDLDVRLAGLRRQGLAIHARRLERLAAQPMHPACDSPWHAPRAPSGHWFAARRADRSIGAAARLAAWLMGWGLLLMALAALLMAGRGG